MVLYNLYSSECSIRSKYDCVETLFEDLRTFITLVFSCNTVASLEAYFEKDYHKGGIFFYDTTEERAIPGTNFCGKMGVQKYMSMVAYQARLNGDMIWHLARKMCGRVLVLRDVV